MNRTPKSVWHSPVHFAAFGFGSGAAPFAPGTFGTLAAIPLYWCLSWLSLPAYSVILLITFFVGIWFCGRTSCDIGVHDHSGIVWDEFVGYWITLWGVPFSWKAVVLGFVFFRIFDVMKPWPIRTIDRRVTGGFGIMLDDVMAGIFALCLTHLVLWMFWS